MFCESEGGGGGQINCQININNFSYLIKPALNTETVDIHLTTVLFGLSSIPSINTEECRLFLHIISLSPRSAVVIVDHCDARLALEHGAKLGPAWQCANKTEVSPASQCSNIFNSCHTLLDLTGPLQLGALPGKIFSVSKYFLSRR